MSEATTGADDTDEVIENAGYPMLHRNSVFTAVGRLESADTGQYGYGEWTPGDGPRFGIVEGVSNAAVARSSIEHGNVDGATRLFAHAINHLLYALMAVPGHEEADVGCEEDRLFARTGENFAARIKDHGPGRNWVGYDPDLDVQKALDEMMQMRDPAQNGDHDGAVNHAANAVNHLVFVLDNMTSESGAVEAVVEMEASAGEVDDGGE